MHRLPPPAYRHGPLESSLFWSVFARVFFHAAVGVYPQNRNVRHLSERPSWRGFSPSRAWRFQLPTWPRRNAGSMGIRHISQIWNSSKQCSRHHPSASAPLRTWPNRTVPGNAARTFPASCPALNSSSLPMPPYHCIRPSRLIRHAANRNRQQARRSPPRNSGAIARPNSLPVVPRRRREATRRCGDSGNSEDRPGSPARKSVWPRRNR